MSRRLVRALWAGLLGGVLAGGGDALATLGTAWTVSSASNALGLLALGCAAGVSLGLGLALLALLLSLLAAPVAVRVPRLTGSGLVAIMLAAPLVSYDAFALFDGAKAARLPGHQAISIGLILLVLVSVALIGNLWQRLIAYLEKSPKAHRAWLVAACLLALALAAAKANRVVLPRLYPWFHLTLGLLSVAACVLASRAWQTGQGWPQARLRNQMVALVAGLLALSGLAAVGFSAIRASQSLRFLVFEKTPVAALVLRLVPTQQRPGAGRAAAVSTAAASPLPEGPHRPDADIVLITVDALRADHMGAYGYDRPTTPNLDALAKRAVRFERAYAQAPHTSFSIASLMTGKYYPTLARLAPHSQHETLPLTLRRYGWKTAAFFPPAVFFIDAHKMKAFETSNFDFEYVKYEYLDAEQRVDQIDDFFRQENPRKVFLWLHLFEPHEPYLLHKGFDFGNRDIDRYDSEIAYCDAVVGRVIAHLQETRPKAIIVVTADHGEEFDEHGGRYHGTTLYDEQVRVPLIIYVPGVPAQVVPGPVQVIDIAPTLLGLIDVLAPARMRGTDLGPWLNLPSAPADRFPPVFAEVQDKRMVVSGQDKLICDLAKDFCAYHDLAADPHERRDRAEARPQRVAELRQLLDTWLDEQARLESNRLAYADAPSGDLAKVIERGRLGEADAAPGLAAGLQSKAPLEMRRTAARLLVEALPARPDTSPMLVAAMDGADDEEIRDWSAVALMRLGEVAGRPRLLKLLDRPGGEAPQALRLQAAMALAQTGDGAGLTVLVDGLDGCAANEALCKFIIVALRKLRDPRAVPALITQLPDVRTRLDVVQVLGETGATSAVPALVERLKSDEYVHVRVAAAHALAQIGGARAVLALKWSSQNEKEPRVLDAARAALKEMRQSQ